MTHIDAMNVEPDGEAGFPPIFIAQHAQVGIYLWQRQSPSSAPTDRLFRATWPSRSTLPVPQPLSSSRNGGGSTNKSAASPTVWRAQVTSHSCPTSTAASRRL